MAYEYIMLGVCVNEISIKIFESVKYGSKFRTINQHTLSAAKMT